MPDETAAFDLSLIDPYIEHNRLVVMRRREEQARLIAEYEAEHGEITDEEMARLWND